MFSMDMAFFYLATVLSTLVHGSLVDALGEEHIRWVAMGTMVLSLVPMALWAWFTRRVEQRDQRKALALSQT